MKNAAVALVIAIPLLASHPVAARDLVSAGMVVSSATAGLIASAQGCGPECGGAPSLATAPAIFGYGYRVTYYGNGFSISRPIRDTPTMSADDSVAVAAGSLPSRSRTVWPQRDGCYGLGQRPNQARHHKQEKASAINNPPPAARKANR